MIQGSIVQGSITELVNRFLSEQDIKKNSLARYSYELSIYIRWVHATGRNFWHLGKADAIAYKNHLIQYQVTTQRNYLTTVNVFYKWAVDNNPNLPNIFHGIRLPRNTQGIKRNPLSSNDITLLYKQFEGKPSPILMRDRAMITLMLECGLRRIEVIRLMVEDIIEINHLFYAMVLGKGTDHKTKISLTSRALSDINDWMVVDTHMEEGKPLFHGYDNKPLHPISVSNIITKYLNRAGMGKGFSCHSLRHTGAMMIYEATRDIIRVKAFLRHNSIMATQLYLKKTEWTINNDGKIQEIMNKIKRDQPYY